jgi:hypothetical protein
MDSQKRLSLLQNMLSRLTGTGTVPEVVAEPAVTPPAPVQAPPPDPRERKLQLLQSMLSKLQGS